MTHACLHLGIHEHFIKVGEDQEFKERTISSLKSRSRGLPRALILPSSWRLVRNLWVNYWLIPKGHQFENTIWRNQSLFSRSANIWALQASRTTSLHSSIFEDLESWTGLPYSKAIPTGPTFRRISSRVRAWTLTRCLFLKCLRWGPNPECT